MPPATLAPRRSALALLLLSAVNFMVILDSQIVILGLPSIGRDLGFAPADTQWVLSAYLIPFGGLLLLGGRAGDLLGRRRVLMTGAALFGLASLGCGLAWSPAALVGARALQGVSAALMAPTALAILMTTWTEGRERNRALAVWGGLGGLGATAALLVGGTVTEGLGWPWIFFLNLPVAVVLLVLAPRLLAESRDPARRRSFDPAGALTLTIGLVLLILAVVRAPEAGWTGAGTLVPLAGALAALAAFGVAEARSAAPLVPLGLLGRRSLAGGNLVMLLAGMAAWGTGLSTSVYAQDVLGWSPLAFGLATAALTITAGLGSYAAQAALSRWSPAVVAGAGMALLAAGGLLLTGVSPHGGYVADLLPGLVAFGAGLGAGTVAASVAALAGVPEPDAGVASGVNTAAFQIGGALGGAVVTSVTAAQAAGAAGLTAGLRSGFAVCAAFAAVGLAGVIALLRTPRHAPAPSPRTDPECAR